MLLLSRFVVHCASTESAQHFLSELLQYLQYVHYLHNMLQFGMSWFRVVMVLHCTVRQRLYVTVVYLLLSF